MRPLACFTVDLLFGRHATIRPIITTFAARRACRDVPPLLRKEERKVRATQSAALPNG